MKRLLQLTAIAAVLTAVAVPSLAEQAAQLAKRATAPKNTGTHATMTPAQPAAPITSAATRRFLEAPAPNRLPVRRATAAEAAGVPTIYGTVTQSSYGSVTYNKPGVYQLPVADGDDFELVAGNIEAKYGATLIGGTLYVPTQEDVDFFGTFYAVDKYDVNNEYESLGSNSVSNDHFKSRCSAPDPTEENIAYGCFYNGDAGYNFSKVNYVTRQENVIAKISTQWQLCGINADGELYAIDSQKRLYSVDKATGTQTLLTTLSDLYLSGWNAGVFDLKSGLLYISSSKSWDGKKAALYSLNVETFELVKIHEYAYGETLTSMFIPVSNVAANAPGAPADLTADFPAGALSGTVHFTMPATYYDGSIASGAFHWSVAIDGVEAAAGMEVAGATVNATVSVTSEGFHKIEATCSNSNGTGPKAKTSLYIGKDAPLAVTDVTASYADGQINVSWQPASGSVNGGYVDPAQTTYTVTRQPDGVVVAQDIAQTSIQRPYSVPDGEMASFTFQVVATYDGHQSAAATSNPVILGNLTAPHTWTFDKTDALAGCTIINANNDEKTWTLDSYGKCVKVGFNRSLAMDDWFITEPIRLQGGFAYTLAFDVKASSATYSEHIEVKYGTANTVAGMTEMLVDRFEIPTSTYETHTTRFTPPADGIYYIGFHGCSAADRNNLFLSNIKLTAGAAPVAPQGVSGLTITPDADGHNSVAIAFTAPSKNVDGSDLDACEIKISRNGEHLETLQAAAGESKTYTDTPAAGGEYTYTLVPVANGLEGESQSQTVFVGLHQPQPVTGVTVNETASDGEVTVTWTAPALDADGNPFNSSLVRYNIYFTDGETDFALVGDKVTGTAFTHRVNDGTSQSLALYLVEAVTDGGKAATVASEAIAVGKAFTLPYADSFAGTNDYIYGTRSLKGTNKWMTLDDYTVDIVESADGDNAFLAVQQTGAPAVAEFYTGKIAIPAGAAPYLSFYTFNVIDAAGVNPDLNTIDVMVRADGSWQAAQQTVVGQTGDPLRWNKVFVPLADYAGKSIQLALRVTSNTYQLTFFDVLRIGDEDADNLAIEAFDFPGEIYAGADTDFDIIVANRGMNPAKDFSLRLRIDGADAYTIAMPKILAPGQKVRHTVTHRFDVTDNATHTVEAVVDHLADEIAADNTSGVKEIAIDPSNFPAATGLTATEADGLITLAWEAPDMSAARPDAVTEGFEGYEGFDRNPAGWTMVDADHGAIGGIRNITLPGIAPGSEQAFWVNEAAAEVYGDATSTFAGHNSAKSLMQMYVTTTDAEGNTVACDDWAISPELYGCKQTVGLWARSYAANMPESFEILHSAGSTDTADFVKAAEYKGVPGVWTHYAVQLPQGARRVAVRCTSRDKFSFLVDDITFIPAQGATGLTLAGYDIFCNGQQIGSATETSFIVEAPATDATLAYTVVARYDRGVAPASNEVLVDYTGIADIGNDDDTWRYYNLQGIEVQSADLFPGIYIRQATDGRAEKIIIR